MTCATLLAGCTDGGNGPGGETSRESSPDAARSEGDAERGATDTDAVTGALPAASPTEQADPAEQPHTAADAWAFVRKVIVDPETVGSGVAPGAPYESDPNTWAVLGEDCVWQREGLQREVLIRDMPVGPGRIRSPQACCCLADYQRYQRPLRPPVSAERMTKPSSQTTSTMTAIHHRAFSAKPAPKRIRANRRTRSRGTIVINLRRSSCPANARTHGRFPRFLHRTFGHWTQFLLAVTSPPGRWATVGSSSSRAEWPQALAVRVQVAAQTDAGLPRVSCRAVGR